MRRRSPTCDGLVAIIARSLAEVRLNAGPKVHQESIALREFLPEVSVFAIMEAKGLVFAPRFGRERDSSPRDVAFRRGSARRVRRAPQIDRCFEEEKLGTVDALLLCRGALATREEDMLLILLIVVLLVALGGGGWGYSRYGAVGFGPAGLLILVLLVMYFTGHLA